MTSLKTAARAHRYRSGAALSEYVIVIHFALAGVIGLTWLFGDDIRALFAAAGNSLAGIDSTPLTRAASMGNPLEKPRDLTAVQAALRNALTQEKTHPDWRPAPNVHLEVAAHMRKVSDIPKTQALFVALDDMLNQDRLFHPATAGEEYHQLGQAIDANGVTLEYRYQGRQYTISGLGKHDPEHGRISIYQWRGGSSRQSAFFRPGQPGFDLPGMDTHDFNSLLLALRQSGVTNAHIDLSPGSPVNRAFALTDGQDGNGIETLRPATDPGTMKHIAERLERLNGKLLLHEAGQDDPTKITGAELVDLFNSDDPGQRLALEHPSVDFPNLLKFLADLATVPEPAVFDPQDPWQDPLKNFRMELGLIDGLLNPEKPYKSWRTHNALAQYGFSFPLRRGMILDLPSSASSVQPSQAERDWAQQNRIALATASHIGYGFWHLGNDITWRVHSDIRSTGKLGQGMLNARDLENRFLGIVGWMQSATLTGDPTVLDSIPAHEIQVILAGAHATEGFFSFFEPFVWAIDMWRMRRALQTGGEEGPGIPAENILTLSQVTDHDLLTAVKARIRSAHPGQAVLLYIQAHGVEIPENPVGGKIAMSDDTILKNSQLAELYDLAERRGVKLALISGTCHSGSQVAAIRQPEIDRLLASGQAHPHLELMASVRQRLWSLHHNLVRYTRKSNSLSPAMRLPGFLGRTSLWGYRPVVRQDDKWRAGPSLLEHLKNHPRHGPFVQHLIRNKEEENCSMFWGVLANTPECDLLVTYEHLSDVSEDLHTLAQAQATIRNAPELLERFPKLQSMLENPVFKPTLDWGSYRYLTTTDFIQAMDLADDVLTDLIRESNKAANRAEISPVPDHREAPGGKRRTTPGRG